MNHEAVLLTELVQGPALQLIVVDELHFILSGNESLQQLQEVRAQGFLVVPARNSKTLSVGILQYMYVL